MNHLEDYKFNSVYELANLIDSFVKDEVDFWNFNKCYFIHAATKFSKETLLHQYIVTTALNYYHRDFRKNSDFYDCEEGIEKWYDLFKTYSIRIKKFDFDNETEIETWFNINFKKFVLLFEKMADETFYILFSNRQFLLSFNNIVSETVKEIGIPKQFLTEKGTIRRTTIPQWVKKAVFHRDKGRCVFCTSDLTGLINPLTVSNFDHIVPLDMYGANDPCNIQLTCEKCNKSKKNKKGATGTNYSPWWPK